MRNQFPVDSPQQLGEYIRALRKARGYTQAEVARFLGVSTPRVAVIEKDVGRVSTKSMIELLKLLGARLELHTETAPTAAPSATSSTATSSTATSPTTASKGEW